MKEVFLLDQISRILITGVNGWLGHSLLRTLLVDAKDAGFSETLKPHQSVFGIDQLGSASSNDPRYRFFQGNLRQIGVDHGFFHKAEGAVLFHLAGLIHPRRTREFYEVNVEATINVLKNAREQGIRKAILLSSNSTCGNNPHPDHRFDEFSPYNPYMSYGASKREMEMRALDFADKTNFDVVIIRAPWFYGPFQPTRQLLFFRMIRDGKMPLFGPGENLRSMAYIDNVVQGLLKAAETSTTRRIYWIADEHPYRMREIVETVQDVLEVEHSIKVRKYLLQLPGIICDLAEIADGLIQKAGWYHQKIHVLSEMNKTIACSVRLAREELGYQPQISLREGIVKSLKNIHLDTL